MLSPPANGSPVTGRPLVNLTLAVNYALSGEQTWSYHALNLAIHLFAGLTLFGLVRRTLADPVGAQTRLTLGGARSRPARLQSDALPIAFAVALLWTVHPLQTESVTYIVQRAESLMGLFYLLTLYCFARAAAWEEKSGAAAAGAPNLFPAGSETVLPVASAPRQRRFTPATAWRILSVGACLLGMATKEVMVSAPLLVLLYDRTFVAGGFRAALRRRRGFYASLAATWVLLAWLVVGAGSRGETAGFGLGVTPWSYALRQGDAILRYLGLSLWPHRLMIDYGTNLAPTAAASVAGTVLVALLVAATGVALWRRPAVGFLGAWFFAILAPSSSLVPVATELIAEHRMYLSLAAVIAALVLGLHAWAGRRSLVVCVLLAVALGWLTLRRNEDYRSNVALWTDAVAKQPANARAHTNLGSAWLVAGNPTTALAEEKEALRLQPDLVEAAFYAGQASLKLGREAGAVRYYETALKIEPDYFQADVELGNLELRAGRYADACAHYEVVLRKLPQFAQVHYNLAMARLQMGQFDAAIAELETVLRLRPAMAEASYNLGAVFLQLGRLPQAQAAFERTLQLQPDNSAAHNNLANILLPAGRLTEAVDHYRAALRSDPANFAAHFNLGTALRELHQLPEAKAQFEAALRLQPDSQPARAALDQLNGPP